MLVPPLNLIGWFFYARNFYLYQMKIISTIIVAIIIFSSCKYSNKELNQQLVLADSVAINFFKGDGTMDTVVQVRMVKDKRIMTELSSFITEHMANEKNNCGYDGSLHFFKNNMVMQDIYFRMNNNDDGCNQFTYLFNRQKHAGKLSAAAKKLLQQLKE